MASCAHNRSKTKCNGDDIVHVCPKANHGPCPFCSGVDYSRDLSARREYPIYKASSMKAFEFRRVSE